MKKALLILVGMLAFAASISAQWPRMQDPTSPPVPRDAQGRVNMTAPAPRGEDGKPNFSGVWMRANSGPPRGGGAGAGARQGGAAAPAAPNGGAAPAAGEGQPGFGPVRGGVQLEPPTDGFPFDPNGPPVATFFEAGANIPGGLPYTPWAAELRKQRLALNARDNPDAMCFPMGFLQFHQQPQPRKIYHLPKMILIEYEANYGIRKIYLDGRKLPPQGEPQPWWYGYSVGRWEGDTLVVETNNLRGAEESPYDGWMDVNGSPYSNQAKFTERFRRPSFGQLQIDLTIEDPKAYTRPWTVRVDQRYLPDEELIEFICNENQQFRRKIKID
jgi:hypothetical protein